MARTAGAYAEATAVPQHSLTEGMVPIPEGVTDEDAAALPVAGMAALSAVELLKAGPGKALVIAGAAGAVGGFATQIARSRGAKVLAIVRPGSREEALRLGAMEVYEGALHEAIEQLHEMHPEGVDGVLDLVSGKDAIGDHLRALKTGGTLVSSLRVVDEQWFARHRIAGVNLSSATSPLPLPEGLMTLGRLLQEGVLTTRIRSVVPLEAVAGAMERLREGGLQGKILLRM